MPTYCRHSLSLAGGQGIGPRRTEMNDPLRDYQRWNYVESVAVAVAVAIGVVVVAQMTSEEAKRAMLDVAESYDQLAQKAARRRP